MSRTLLVFFVLLTGCSGRERPLQFNLGDEAVQLDWNRTIDSSSAVILDNVMEGLTSYVDSLEGSSADLLRPMPALAFSWSVSEGGKVYRFHLRPGVFWSDGVALEARQFVDSWERLLNPVTASSNAYQLLDIENAAAYAEGRLKDFSKVGVKALDSLTLEVRLRRPVPYFLHLVASASTFPIRADLVAKFGEQWMDPEHLVTLGPYRISEWSQGDKIVLKAFSGYHGIRPRISTIICRLIAEPLTAFALYENGDLDIVPRELPPSYARRLQSHLDYRSGPKLAVNYLLFNVKRAPFDSPARRRAFIKAMNRGELAAFFEGSQTPVTSWIPPGLLGYAPELGVVADNQPSNEISASSVDLQFSGSDTWNLVFQAMQRMMAGKLKLKAKLDWLESREFAKFLAQLSGPARPKTLPHLMLLGWVADYPDPHSFMNIFTSTSENNYMGWKNHRYDELVENAISTPDESLRKRFYLEAQKLLLEEETVLMPLFLGGHHALVRNSLHGVQLNVLDKWYFQKIEFKESAWHGFNILRRLRSSG